MKHNSFESDLTCSVVINTYNRRAFLERLLPGLHHLSGVQFEVVVVNGPSTDGTTAFLNDYRDQVKVVDCASRNLSHSRNLGIAASSGDIVVFIDDDALPADTDWLARYVAAFADDRAGQLGGAGGPVLHRDTNLFEFNGGLTSDYGFHIFDLVQADQGASDNQRWIAGVRGCNCAFRRTALVQIGGFDEFFTYYLDETDVCMRLVRAGFRIAHLPNNKVRHYSAPSAVRVNQFDRNWHVVTRSDTYFALKNGADTLPVRLVKTIAAAPRKHYVSEINSYVRNKQISVKHWLRLISKWQSGLLRGLHAGVTQPRKKGDFRHPPPPLLLLHQPLVERRLRIALLTQTVPGMGGYGGVSRYTFDLAKGLHERGHDVCIICKGEQQNHYSLNFLIQGIPAASYVFPEEGDGRPLLHKNLNYSISVVHMLAELYAQGIEFDVVHATNWDAEGVALIRAQLYPTVLMLVSPLAQVIVTEHWPQSDDLRQCLALDRWQIEHADGVCVPSEGVLSSYRNLMGLVPEALAYLYTTPLGIVPQAPVHSAAYVGRHRLLFVGRCERRKGVHTLLSVLPEVLTAFPDWECHLVGDDQVPLAEGGTLKEHFLHTWRGAWWLNRVVFHGQLAENDLQQQYQQCDLFVAPSLFESFGLIYHEAMQYGKAVVGCRTGGVPEVVEHGVEGLLVSPDCPDELRAALYQLMAHSDQREQMGKAGAHRVHQVTNYRTMAARLEQVYLQTIARVGPERSAQRARFWPHALLLFEPGDTLLLAGDWVVQEATSGQHYYVGQFGASICFQAQAGSILRIVALRHAWSGVLEVIVSGEPVQYIDLYKPGELQLDYSVSLVLGQPTEEQLLDVRLRIHSERNPQSHASQVWLKQIFANALPQREYRP